MTIEKASTIEESIALLLRDQDKLEVFEGEISKVVDLLLVKKSAEEAVSNAVSGITDTYGVPKRVVRSIAKAVIAQNTENLRSESRAVTELTDALFN